MDTAHNLDDHLDLGIVQDNIQIGDHAVGIRSRRHILDLKDVFKIDLLAET